MKNIFKLCAISLIFSACAAIASAPSPTETPAQRAIADIEARFPGQSAHTVDYGTALKTAKKSVTLGIGFWPQTAYICYRPHNRFLGTSRNMCAQISHDTVSDTTTHITYTPADSKVIAQHLAGCKLAEQKHVDSNFLSHFKEAMGN